jgi:ABC-type lipoprotein export system ATPase subunit
MSDSRRVKANLPPSVSLRIRLKIPRTKKASRDQSVDLSLALLAAAAAAEVATALPTATIALIAQTVNLLEATTLQNRVQWTVLTRKRKKQKKTNESGITSVI